MSRRRRRYPRSKHYTKPLEEHKKSNEVKVFGWILIGYGLYFVINFIPFAVVNPKEAFLDEYIPFFVELMPALFFFNLFIIFVSSCIVKLVVPLFSILYGIEMIRLTEKGRESLVKMYYINIVAYLMLLAVILSYSGLRVWLLGSMNIFYHFFVILFGILVIFFATRPEVKEQFK